MHLIKPFRILWSPSSNHLKSFLVGNTSECSAARVLWTIPAATCAKRMPVKVNSSLLCNTVTAFPLHQTSFLVRHTPGMFSSKSTLNNTSRDRFKKKDCYGEEVMLSVLYSLPVDPTPFLAGLTSECSAVKVLWTIPVMLLSKIIPEKGRRTVLPCWPCGVSCILRRGGHTESSIRMDISHPVHRVLSSCVDLFRSYAFGTVVFDDGIDDWGLMHLMWLLASGYKSQVTSIWH